MMTQAHIDLQTQIEKILLTSLPDLSLLIPPVFFLETHDQVNALSSEQIEQTEHTTSSNVNTPPDNTNGTPPPPK